MNTMRRAPLAGPPLALQIVGLLLGGLIIAQMVTLLLTMLLPPEPQPQYGLDEIATALSGSPAKTHMARPLQRVLQSGPPAFSGPGWLTSERSRRDLARLLDRDETDVQIFFYTPLPFAGTGGRQERDVRTTRAMVRLASNETRSLLPADRDPGMQVAQNFPAAGDARFPGGGFPGGFPGGGFPGAGVPGSLPGGVPRGPLPGGGFPARPDMPGRAAPQNMPTRPSGLPPTVSRPMPLGGVGQPALLAGRPGLIGIQPKLIVPDILPGQVISQGLMPPIIPSPSVHRTPALAHTYNRDVSATVPMPSLPRLREMPVQTSVPLPVSAPRAALAPNKAPVPVPVTPQLARGLFGVAPAPFVEGDFVAALRLADDQWALVRPTPEPFPNSWQRRVILWFLISFALVAPLGWIFAQRVVRPIAGFAQAAERLGRDPTTLVLALEGPAEVGRAAHAFNRMQSRLRSFVDDRTAMVGAISHDLRTPLTRLRFRIEDVPDELRDGMLAEVDEMEQMISSVLTFIRDASEPGLRETLDLRSIVEDVVEDAVFVGKPVTLEEGGRAEVEVDPLGIRRLLGNLVENAVKYGDTARVRLFTDQQDVVAEVRDNGPGLPEDELERVFQPFYRTPAAHASNKHGSGLGLAVCRSIARAHGGDVRLRRGDDGLVAQLRLPLAYGATAS